MAARWKQTAMSINPELQIGDNSFTGGLTPEELAAAIVKGWDNDPEKDAPEAEKLMWDIQMIGIRVGMFAHGEDFLTEAGAPEHIIKEYRESKWDAIAQAAAKKLGMDDYRPLLLNTRTKKQEKVMAEIAAGEERNRLFCYLGTNYRVAAELMTLILAEEIGADYTTITDREDWLDISNTVAFLVRYFFALHGEHRKDGFDEIDPLEKANLTDSQREELHDMIKTLVAYRQRHGGGYYENIAPCFCLDSTATRRFESYRQTEFSKTESVFLPVSKAWQIQHEIGKVGDDPSKEFSSDFDVSPRGKDPAVVKATISDIKGNPIEIDGIMRGAQMAIGNLIDKKGGYLPIVVTPDQVYREWACLESNVDVTPQQAAEMEAAIDSLTSAPARIDFQAQLHQHTRIKRQPDYDYDSPQAGRLSSNMIMAEKVEAERKDGSRTIAYRVLSYPMLYRYSHIVGQIASVNRALITGGENKPEVEKGKKAQSGSRDVAMRHNVLTRIERMKSTTKCTRKILLEEIMSDLLIPVSRQTERTLLKNLEQYLNELQAQGEIKKFAPLMGGRGNRKYIGFTLTL